MASNSKKGSTGKGAKKAPKVEVWNVCATCPAGRSLVRQVAAAVRKKLGIRLRSR